MSEWKLIETAPRDGTWIWAWRGESHFGTRSPMVAVRWCTFDDGDAAWCWPDDIYDPFHEGGIEDADSQVLNGNSYEDTKNFTHWMPLTKAPKP